MADEDMHELLMAPFEKKEQPKVSMPFFFFSVCACSLVVSFFIFLIYLSHI